MRVSTSFMQLYSSEVICTVQYKLRHAREGWGGGGGGGTWG